MQYFSNFSHSVPVSGSPEQHQPIAAPSAESRSRLTATAADLGGMAAQQAAIAKAYGDILLNGGHISC